MIVNAKGGQDRASAFADALVMEIKLEMTRQSIGSVSELARRSGIHQSTLFERLEHRRNGKGRVPLGMEDLFRIAQALEVQPRELVQRAWEAQDPTPLMQADTPKGRNRSA